MTKKKQTRTKSEIIRMNIDSVDIEKIKKIANGLKAGKTIIYPTDTVYGIGAVISNENAIKRIRRVKKNPASKPLSMALSSIEKIKKYAEVTESQFAFIKEQLPGPVTVILPKKDAVYSESGTLISGVPDYVSKKTIGIRVPDSRALRRLIELTDPLITTSANKMGEAAPWAFNQIKIKADIMIDGGMCKYKKPSRVIDMTVGEILRD
ncbi:L-threonylcarbamoyladenylate synthase [Candidatus Undinarchaeota archaeon]